MTARTPAWSENGHNCISASRGEAGPNPALTRNREAPTHRADADLRLPSGSTKAALDRLVPELPAQRHPRDLSEGQRLSLALAVVLAAAPPLVLLDEPTRGLDYPAEERLVGQLRALTSAGTAAVLATHDVELVAEVAARTVVLADGEVVADGPTREVVVHSPAFAPQVAKVLAPAEWLAVADVGRALAAAP